MNISTRILLSVLLFSVFTIHHSALAQRNCATMSLYQQVIQNDPQQAIEYQNTKAQNRQYVNAHIGETSKAIVTIPVVVHVVYNGATQNISDAQIQSQIAILNKDFRKLNTDVVPTNVQTAFGSLRADSQIEFCLAVRDPNGNTTNGITRTSTTKSSFYNMGADDVKSTSTGGENGWDRTKYLNIWVCNIAGTILGYATFPGTGSAANDGVVIDYTYFGDIGTATAPYNKGRTATHEIGHWLGLTHIWGDDNDCSGSDDISDTPNQSVENGGCPSWPHSTCGNTSDMYMNYMDYTNDACMYMFTTEQAAVMNATLNGTRASLKSSNGCTPTVLYAKDIGISAITKPSGTDCAIDISPIVVLKNFGTDQIVSATIDYQIDGGTVITKGWTGALNSLESTSVVLDPITVATGAHNFSATSRLPNGVSDNFTINDSKSVSYSGVSVTTLDLPFIEDFEPATFPPSGWTLNNPTGVSTWTRENVGGFGESNFSTRMNNFVGATNGELDELVSPNFNFTPVGTAKMYFSVAYAPEAAVSPTDSLIIYASDNCGGSWLKVYAKGGSEIATSSAISSAFLPTNVEWVKDSASLTQFKKKPSVRVKIQSKSGAGNNIFIDDINIDYSGVGIAETKLAMKTNLFYMHPNPSDGNLTLTLTDRNLRSLTVCVNNVLGEKVLQQRFTSPQNGMVQLDLKNLNQGVYFVEVNTGNSLEVKKLFISK